jgi:hypothetical protein
LRRSLLKLARLLVLLINATHLQQLIFLLDNVSATFIQLLIFLLDTAGRRTRGCILRAREART